MATKKDIAELKTSISQINQAIGEIRDSVIKTLLKENNTLKERIKSLEIEASEMQQYREDRILHKYAQKLMKCLQ